MIPIIPKWLKQLKKDIKWDLIREDGRLERHCEHGVGHTVGNIDPKELKSNYHRVHGCCGEHCCKDWPRQEVPK